MLPCSGAPARWPQDLCTTGDFIPKCCIHEPGCLPSLNCFNVLFTKRLSRTFAIQQPLFLVPDGPYNLDVNTVVTWPKSPPAGLSLLPPLPPAPPLLHHSIPFAEVNSLQEAHMPLPGRLGVSARSADSPQRHQRHFPSEPAPWPLHALPLFALISAQFKPPSNN